MSEEEFKNLIQEKGYATLNDKGILYALVDSVDAIKPATDDIMGIAARAGYKHSYGVAVAKKA